MPDAQVMTLAVHVVVGLAGSLVKLDGIYVGFSGHFRRHLREVGSNYPDSGFFGAAIRNTRT